MKTAFITGIDGFVGSHLAELLLTKNYNVSGSVYNTKNITNIKHIQRDLNLSVCDITDKKKLESIVRKLKPEIVFHLAGIASIPESFKEPGKTYSINFWGTYNLLESVRRCSPDSRILVVGSAHEYGRVNPRDLPVKEDHPLNPETPYGASKAAQEMLALQYFNSYRMRIFLVRAFNHIGPRQSPEFVVSSFAKQVAEIVLKKREVVITGNLDVYRDFTDVRDVVNAYLLIVNKGKPGEIYNVCRGHPFKLRSILRLLFKIAGCNAKVVIDKRRLRKSELLKFYGNNEKLKKATGWDAKYIIEETLNELLEWWMGVLST